MQASVEQPVFPGDVSFYFEISPLGPSNHSAKPMGEPIGRPHYQIIWIARGSGVISIDLERYMITDNAIYTIPPGRFYLFDQGSEVSGYVLSYNIDFLYLVLEGPGRPFFKEMSADLNCVKMLRLDAGKSSLQNLLAEIVRESETRLILRLEILSGLFKIFLVQIKRLAPTVRLEEASSHHMRLFNSFHAKLDKEFKTKKHVADYANDLSVRPSHLTYAVKKVTGYSANYHIQQRMVQEAKRLALYSDANMKTVAYSLGFYDLSHFSKYFKNVAGINFSEYKKRTFIRHVN
jgi:AraC family transcriptional activator of pobA